MPNTTASLFYIEFEGLDPLPIRSITEVKFEAQVAGADTEIECTKGGRTQRQSTSSGFQTTPSMTIEVNMSGDQSSASKIVYDWFNESLPSSALGGGNWAGSRKSVGITVYDPDGKKQVMRWDIVNAWVKNYSIVDTDAAGSDILVESYEFVAEDIRKTVEMEQAAA